MSNINFVIENVSDASMIIAGIGTRKDKRAKAVSEIMDFISAGKPLDAKSVELLESEGIRWSDALLKSFQPQDEKKFQKRTQVLEDLMSAAGAVRKFGRVAPEIGTIGSLYGDLKSFLKLGAVLRTRNASGMSIGLLAEVWEQVAVKMQEMWIVRTGEEMVLIHWDVSKNRHGEGGKYSASDNIRELFRVAITGYTSKGKDLMFIFGEEDGWNKREQKMFQAISEAINLLGPDYITELDGKLTSEELAKRFFGLIVKARTINQWKNVANNFCVMLNEYDAANNPQKIVVPSDRREVMNDIHSQNPETAI